MTAARVAAARRGPYQLEPLRDVECAHFELESLYETAKKNQWNARRLIAPRIEPCDRAIGIPGLRGSS